MILEPFIPYFTVYVTKCALTDGIKLVRVKDTDLPGLVVDFGAYPTYYHEDKDWHRTFAPARARAETMRKNKIASLKRQIEKLEKMDFYVLDVNLTERPA